MTGLHRRMRMSLAVAGMVAVMQHGWAEELPAPAAGQGDTFHIERPEVVVGLIGRYNASQIKPVLGATTKSRDTSLQQTLGLSTQGYAVRPEFLEFNLAGTFGLEEQWERRESGSENKVDSPYEYHFDGTFLRDSSAPLKLTADRTIEYTSVPFSETYRTTTNVYDALWDIKSDRFPTTFRLLHSDIAQDSLTGLDNFDYAQNSAEWHTDAIFGPGNRLSWNYNFTSVDESTAFGRESSFNANTASLVHEYLFGPKRQNSLISTVSYLDQDGDFAQERFRLDENLLWRHTDSLQTFYQYQFEDTRFPQVETSLNRLKAGFRDKVFENLLATGTIGGMAMEQDGAATDEIFAHLDFDYTRKVPLGQLAATLAFSLDRQANDAQNTEAHVLDSRTFDASQQIVIPYVGIKSNSIGVRDASGSRVFFQGLDYLTTYHQNRVVIQRMPGGSIAPNSTILVDYDITPKPANDVATDSINMGLRYDFKEGIFKGLGLYTRYFVQDQDISSDQPGAFIPDNINALVYGVEYRIWRLRFSAEHEDHDSDLMPFRSDRYSARYEDRIARDWRILADITQVHTTYVDDSSTPIATTMSGKIEYRPARDVRAGVSVAYLRMRDEINGGARGLEEQFDIKWTHRDTTFKGLVRHASLETDPQDSSFLFFQLSAERRF